MSDTLSTLAALGRFGAFGARISWTTLRLGWSLREVIHHIGQLVSRCVVPVVAVVLPAGMVLALQGGTVFALFGAQRLLSSLVSVATFRELAPVLASVLVAAQGGSSIAAELGAMRIREEIDAIEVMAVDPIGLHVVPRILAAIVATPILTLIGALGGVCGGWLVATVILGEPGGLYWANLWDLTRPMDLWGGLIKSSVFGGIIGVVAAFHGFHAHGGAAGVGHAVNDTVVTAITAFIIANYLLTSALFGAGA